jgi:hypothetical protein
LLTPFSRVLRPGIHEAQRMTVDAHMAEGAHSLGEALANVRTYPIRRDVFGRWNTIQGIPAIVRDFPRDEDPVVAHTGPPMV